MSIIKIVFKYYRSKIFILIFIIFESDDQTVYVEKWKYWGGGLAKLGAK